MLIRCAWDCIAASSATPIRWRVAGVAGTASTTTSLCASRSGKPVCRAGQPGSATDERLKNATSIPKPKCARRAMARPIRPMPTTPSRLPVRCRPRSCVGCQPVQPPARTSRSPSPARRALISISVSAISAVASVTAPGVLVTATPAARAAATSIWFVPTPKFARSRARREPVKAPAPNESPSVGSTRS